MKVMSRQIQAVYENGVIRPLEPVHLTEGEELDVILISRQARSPRLSAHILADIAKLPIEGKTDAFSGEQHDQILYPNEER